MDSNQSIHGLIVRLFAGEAGTQEKSEINDWLNLNEENRKLFNDLKEIWLSCGVEQNADCYDVEEAIRKFRQKTTFMDKEDGTKRRIFQFLRYAAILLLIALLPFSYYFGKKHASGFSSMATVSCALGDKTSIVLPDSSSVVLNSGSRLSFSNNFRGGSRQVYLDGEAYFKIKKDPRNPFIVNTTSVKVEVLGTEFNLKAYSDEKTITTTLVNGKLKESGNNKSIVILPNQKLVFDRETKEMNLLQITDLSPETEWKDGRLVFRNQSLGDLKLTLERWFDVEIHFADDLVKSRRFTGTLEHESILEVISYFGLSKYVDYRIKDNKITFFTEKKN